MRLLVCTSYYYYGNPRGLEPQFYYLYKVPASLGYSVDFFDYFTAAAVGTEQMRRVFLATVRGGGYDAVFIATHHDEFDQATLAEAARSCPIIAWNSDDEWRWDSYSQRQAGWYSFMVTNSPNIYAQHKAAYPNLIHAQWACSGFWDGRSTRKDIDFSFITGEVYGARAAQIGWLRRHAGLQAFGRACAATSPSAGREAPAEARTARHPAHDLEVCPAGYRRRGQRAQPRPGEHGSGTARRSRSHRSIARSRTCARSRVACSRWA